MEKHRSRGYVKCPKCEHVFYCDTFTKKSRKRKCKCGNITTGIMKIEDSRHPFYITVTYVDVPPKYGDVKEEK